VRHNEGRGEIGVLDAEREEKRASHPSWIGWDGRIKGVSLSWFTRTDRTAFGSSALGKPIAVNGEAMKKAETTAEELTMRPHYDFSGGVRGKYAERFAGGCTVVVLDPDVAEVFPDAGSVNDTLRELIAARGRKEGSE
jgi:hypothetical protein